jgi:hypothetical protein
MLTLQVQQVKDNVALRFRAAYLLHKVGRGLCVQCWTMRRC